MLAVTRSLAIRRDALWLATVTRARSTGSIRSGSCRPDARNQRANPAASAENDATSTAYLLTGVSRSGAYPAFPIGEVLPLRRGVYCEGTRGKSLVRYGQGTCRHAHPLSSLLAAVVAAAARGGQPVSRSVRSITSST